MQLFYSDTIDGQFGSLNETEARHCLRAMRMRTGDTLYVTDGFGRLYTAVLLVSTDKSCPFAVREVRDMPDPFPFRLHLAVAPTKNEDRFEWLVEKAVEIGITEISCLQCAHSERTTVRSDRIQRLMVSAMKQSLHFRLPAFNPQMTFKQLAGRPHPNSAQCFIAYCGEDNDTLPLKQACCPGGDVTVLIGPEGDFSPEEVLEAKQNGFRPVSLGESRLRTETAALVACATIHFINQ